MLEVTSKGALTEHPEISYIYVDNDLTMRQLVEDMAGAKSIAIDTEADSLYHYYQKVCLIQLSFFGRNYIIDPLSDIKPGKFFKLLSHKPLILHDAAYDLRMMKSSFDFEVNRPVFDTMVAAQLLGCHNLGLSSLLAEFFGVSLAKTGQKSDWSQRPLSESLLRYASADTFYLHMLADLLKEKLETLGRDSWHKESCIKVVNAALNDKLEADPDQAWRIKGTKGLGRAALTMVQQVWKWRDGESQKADIPPFRVMMPKLVIHLSTWAAAHPKMSLSKGPRLPRNCNGRRLEELKKAIAIAHNTPESQRPGHLKPKRRTRSAPESEAMVDELKQEVAIIADQLQISPHVIASRAMLKSIAITKPVTIKDIVRCSGMLGWQGKLIHECVKRVIEKFGRKNRPDEVEEG